MPFARAAQRTWVYNGAHPTAEMKFLNILAAGGTVLAAACSSNRTTTPSPSAPVQSPLPAPVPAPTTTRQISGRVLDEDGIPLSGATVAIPGSPASSSSPAVTDGNGFYHTSATVPAPPSLTFGTEVTITKAGYEDTHGWAAGTGDTTQDFRLYRIMSITAGEA